MKNSLSIILSTSVLISGPASAVTLFAGWDTFSAEPQESSSAPTQLAAGTAATMAAGPGGSWSDWNNNGFGASDDGTFGNLSTTVAMASTNTGGGSGGGDNANLSLNRSQKPGSLIFNLTNTSGTDRLLDGFYFDAVARFSQSASDWTLAFSGAISGTSANGSLVSGNMSAVSAANRDQEIDLSGLADNVWEAGSTATFSLSFTGGDPSTGSGGGQETLIDNIGITGAEVAVIPEPSGMLLSAFGLTGMLLRRKR